MIEDEPVQSPNGRWTIVLSSWEARMSLWIDSPSLVEVASNTAVFAFKDSNWSLDTAVWISDDVVEWRLRKYPGNHLPVDFEVQIDCARASARIDERELPLVHLERALNAKLHWISAPE